MGMNLVDALVIVYDVFPFIFNRLLGTLTTQLHTPG